MRPVVIAGGGPAGATAAALLARAGTRVTVVEREAGPVHKVCGEFLGGPALAALARVGVDVDALGAEPIAHVRIVRGTRVVQAPLGFPGAGLSRYAMDEALLRRAAQDGAEVLRGNAIRSVSGTQLDVEGIGQVVGSSLLLATGKHELRGAKRALRDPPEDLVGFKTHLRLLPGQTEALRGAIELIMFKDGYAGLQLIEGGQANLCLLAARSRFVGAGATWEGLMADLQDESPHLLARLQDASGWPKPLAIARVPYGFVHRGSTGAFRLGDQMGVIPSLAGEGMSIALNSGMAAAHCVLDGGSAAAYHLRMRRDVSRPIRLASALYRCGRSPFGQAVMMAAMRAWPGAVAALAAATRIGESAPRKRARS